MNILQITPHFFLSWEKNKPAELYFELSQALFNCGHNVTIYTTDIFNRDNTLNHKNKNLIMNGISVYEFKSIGWYPFFVSFDVIQALSKTLKKFDIIHVHEYRTFQSIVVHHYARMHKIPYVIHAHGALPTNIGKSTFKKLYDLFFGQRILKDAAKVIAITEVEAKQYESMGISREKIVVIPNGVDFSEFHNLPSRGMFRKKIGISDDEKIVLYLGRLDQTKGIDILVQTFAEISTEIYDSKLIIIGKDYGSKPQLLDLVNELKLNDKVIFTGFLEKTEKMEALVDADVFVSPSFSGFPHTFLEACACGTPIVTTDRFDYLDWINNKVGYIVKYTQSDLKSAILKILEDPMLRSSLSTECKKTVKDNFDWPAIVGNLEHVYQEAITDNDLKKGS